MINISRWLHPPSYIPERHSDNLEEHRRDHGLLSNRSFHFGVREVNCHSGKNDENLLRLEQYIYQCKLNCLIQNYFQMTICFSSNNQF